MCKKKASITVFTLMTILMITAVLFVLIEGSRYAALNRMSTEYADAAVESAFSYYVRPLWEEYKILGIDVGFGSSSHDLYRLNSKVNKLLAKNCMTVNDSNRMNLLGFSQAVAEADSYSFLTDNDGAGFIKEASAAVTMSELGKILKKDGMDLSTGEFDMDSLLNTGNDAINGKIGESTEESTELSASMPDVEAVEVDENPIDTVIGWKNQTILSQVMDVDKLSTSTINTKELISNRQANTGTKETETANATEKLLFRKYIIDTLQNYTQNKGREGLAYELEYVLSGEESDSANLEACVRKLLSVREIENFIAILGDQQKMETAYAIALGLAGGTLSPEMIEIVKYAVIAAWAYVESVLDVRLLLSGGKVSMVKNASEWTSDLTQLATYLNIDVKAKECTNGLSYTDYIYQLLILTNDKKAAFRTMDILEYRIREKTNYANFRMDNVIYKAHFGVHYEVKPVFLALAGIKSGGYTLSREAKMSYL